MAFSTILHPSFSLFGRKNTTSRRHGAQCCCLGEKHAQKLKEAKQLFTRRQYSVARDDQVLMSCPVETLVLIDAVQRLGIDYHFQETIGAVLYDEFCATVADRRREDGLFEVSLSFRLLRQQGHPIPSDVFNKFKNQEGKFQPRLLGHQNVQALIQLYEASQWMTPGEDILHEAGEFSARRLRSWIAPNPSQYYSVVNDVIGLLATEEAVANALKHPYHRSIPRLVIKDYLSSFGATITSKRQSRYVETLKDLAKLDLKMNQAVHQKELDQLSRWWDEVGLGTSVGRDQLLAKASAWPKATLAGPELSEYRVELAKIISIVYLINDIFDMYGSLDDLALFTEAMTRWDTDTIDKLPECMRSCFMVLYRTTNQIGCQVHRKHGWSPINSLKRAWGKLFEAFLVEARWLRTGECPKSDEYLRTGMVTSGAPLMLVHFFYMLGTGLTEENVRLVDSDEPPLISPVAKILRLSDDLSSMYEEDVGYDESYVDCYLKENPGLSVHEARKHVVDMIEDTWKQLNYEYLSPAVPFPTGFMKVVVDSAKMVPLMYEIGFKGDDQESNVDSLPSLQE
ncbi:unnamed protein product [Linum trigynum]|uniref:Uncharacterized protein n=1 Tax=Linum trigynum TaxID=586398 RepID=A0AAV2FHA5_9ROSI